MSTHRYMDSICAAAAAFSLILALLFMNGEALGIQSAGRTTGYESRLFDTSRVHTIEIVMEDWDSFIENCQSEEYSACSVVIDGESYKNVGIRGKGNTSLSSVAAMGSSRYSFKIEFDQYDSSKNYHGLDKLCLNNLIQDNTMMKDYLTYQMMNAFGVPSSLSSFVYITVNGEDWGLYLAVEGAEEAFLQRNYGADYGELYKPDNMNFGGGRGNGRNFDMNKFADQSGEEGEPPTRPGQESAPGDFVPPSIEDSGTPDRTEGESPPEQDTAKRAPGTPPPGMDFGQSDPPSMPGGGFSFGSASDVKLQYIDDDPDSYPNLFGSAKTDVSKADRERLIRSLQALSSYADLENILDMDAVLRYFVVHNFVVNGDSYTGRMIHNYYLYEQDGRLSMIPWDYNLAFGTFQGGTAAASVNEAIDDVLSDRPMQAWIFSDEAYTEAYHKLYAEFLDTVNIEQLIDKAYALIADDVKKDPTKFCTYEEFETGVQTLRSFCSLRQESVRGQLAGTIPSTSEQQKANPDTQIDTGSLNLSDMGTMDRSMGGRGGRNGQSLPSAQDKTANVSEKTGGAQAAEETSPSGKNGDNRDSSPPGGGFAPPSEQTSQLAEQSAVFLGLSVLVLLTGLWIAVKYKKIS